MAEKMAGPLLGHMEWRLGLQARGQSVGVQRVEKRRGREGGLRSSDL